MAPTRITSLLLVTMMVSISTAGCFGDDGLQILPEKKGVPGGLTLACLRDASFTSMVIEIDHAPGYRPYTSSTDLLVERLEQVCDKPGGISVAYREVNFEQQTAWSAQNVRDEGWEHKDASPMDGSTLRWQILFPEGTYEDESVLGVAVDASTVALFGDAIDEADGLLGRPSVEDVENSVIVHEAGHLLGLVNLVYQSPVAHEDSEHPGHSNNEDSVMYWAIESTGLRNFITGDLPSEFDDDDLADLAGLASGDIAVSDQLWP
jgi:hypothetical protein